MDTMKIELIVEKDGQKISGKIEGPYKETKKLVDELFLKIESTKPDKRNYTKYQLKILQLRDAGFLDEPKVTKLLLQELHVKFGITITSNNAQRVLMPLLEAGELDRAFVQPNTKLPKGEFLWFKPKK